MMRLSTSELYLSLSIGLRMNFCVHTTVFLCVHTHMGERENACVCFIASGDR